MLGHAGKILFVDLGSGEIREESLDAKTAREYLGGYGLGVKVLFDEMPAGVDPLGPENIFGVIPGTLNGTPSILASRYTVVGKSPLTGTWGDANSGGFFGPAMKLAGFDAVFFKGIAEKPVYLLLDAGKAELRNASHLWGKEVDTTEDMLREELDDNQIKIASIGPAGEKLSLIAAVMNDKGRAAARSGLGAVMGSKKLKAVVAKGHIEVPVSDPDGLKEKVRSLRQGMNQGMAKMVFDRFNSYGTCAGAAANAMNGDSPVKNWGGVGEEDFPTAENISGLTMVPKYQKRRFACHRCPLGCGGVMEVPDGPFAVKEAHKPEYETLAAFGTMCLNDNVESVILANDICNRAGLDTISAGATIAFAIECFENGLLTLEDTGGIELRWGNSEAIINLLRKIADREGLGDILADGSLKAARKIGKGAEQYAMHAGGQELPMHDPRLAPSLALTYVGDATPGKHMQGGYGFVEMRSPEGAKPGRYEYTGKGKLHADGVKGVHVLNCIGFCLFGRSVVTPEAPIELLNLVTGWDVTAEEAALVGERIATLRQAFNAREGIRPSDVEINPRTIGHPPLEKGPVAGAIVDLDSLRREYFAVMDWDVETGKPGVERLLSLGLENAAKSLY